MSMPFTHRVLSKITNWLSNKEGFTIERQEQTNEFLITDIRDSFGFRYEIRVKNLGRIDTEIKNFDFYTIAAEKEG